MVSREKQKLFFVFLCMLLFVIFGNTAKGAGVSSKITPILQEEINKAPDGKKIPVVIGFKDEVAQQELRRQAKGRRGKAGRDFLVEQLKGNADKKKKRVLRELNKYIGVHHDKRFEPRPLWVINAIAIIADKDVLEKISEFEEVESITYDEPVQLLATPEWNISQIQVPLVWSSMWSLEFWGHP